MIRIKFFTPEECANGEADKFMEEHGARGTQGITVTNAGAYITWEDGVFTKANKRDLLNADKAKNLATKTETEVSLVLYETRRAEMQAIVESTQQEVVDLKEKIANATSNDDKVKLGDKLKAKEDELKFYRDKLGEIQDLFVTSKAEYDRCDQEIKVIDDAIVALESDDMQSDTLKAVLAKYSSKKE